MTVAPRTPRLTTVEVDALIGVVSELYSRLSRGQIEPRIDTKIRSQLTSIQYEIDGM